MLAREPERRDWGPERRTEMKEAQDCGVAGWAAREGAGLGCTRCLLAVGCVGLGDCWTGLLAAQGWLHKGCAGLGCTGWLLAAQGWLRKGCAGLGYLDRGYAGVAAGLHGMAAGCWLHRGWLLAAQRLGVVAALVVVGFRVWAAVKAE
ncbi:hypothetical protein Acr_06g0006740 [Actinidia rufa]|uniref:Uncharacterized protein n=1 Tax=Actinidia rufa TaxID=165716 RepID=A0A7J0EQH5_9ERIC|nr:hypothetical protein Acr_06g0006740 [Actinidia rufa]